ncbi:MAG TPA: anti-toxin [Xanthomonadales bacterium]|nr:anti-toxin [Xanthomonadales bacterium]
MLAIRLPADVEERLAALAEKTGRTKTWYARKAILAYLDDIEDYHLALARIEEERIPLDDVERLLGLAD